MFANIQFTIGHFNGALIGEQLNALGEEFIELKNHMPVDAGPLRNLYYRKTIEFILYLHMCKAKSIQIYSLQNCFQ